VVGVEAKKRFSIKYSRPINVYYPGLRLVDFNASFMIISMIKQLKSVAKIGATLYFVLKYSMFCEFTSRNSDGAKVPEVL